MGRQQDNCDKQVACVCGRGCLSLRGRIDAEREEILQVAFLYQKPRPSRPEALISGSSENDLLKLSSGAEKQQWQKTTPEGHPRV